MLRAVLTASIVMLPAIVVAQDVKTDFDKSFDFSTVRTYSIKIGTAWGNNLAERRVLAEFDEAIAGKGWKRASDNEANVVVVIHGATDTKKTASTFYSGDMGGYGYRYGGWGGGMSSSQTVVNEYRVGMVVVDMFDAKSKNLVFRGTAEDELSDNPDKNKRRLEKASEKMFKNFPPGSKTK